MISRDFPDYATLPIRVVSPPVAEEYRDGWWRIRWSVTAEPADYPRNLHLLKPLPNLDGLSLIVAVLPGAPGHIVIEHLTKYPRLIGEEAAYISLVLQTIRSEGVK